MARNLDPTMAAALDAGVIMPILLAQLTFKSGTEYVHSALGDIVFNGKTFKGVGNLGNVGAITEGVAVHADGTSVSLSGIGDSGVGGETVLYEALNDIRLGAPAKLWFGLMSNGAFLGTPYLIFSGTIDQPDVTVSATSNMITLPLENRLTNLQRANQRRYTSADQHLTHPDDMGFNWQEILQEISLREGS